MKEELIAQQGDVLFKRAVIPDGLVPLETGVVQEGQHTGHAHRLSGDGYQLFEEPNSKEKYIRLVKPTALRHEEHHEIVLPPGDYRVGIVREYSHFDEESRNVSD